MQGTPKGRNGQVIRNGRKIGLGGGNGTKEKRAKGDSIANSWGTSQNAQNLIGKLFFKRRQHCANFL